VGRRRIHGIVYGATFFSIGNYLQKKSDCERNRITIHGTAHGGNILFRWETFAEEIGLRKG